MVSEANIGGNIMIKKHFSQSKECNLEAKGRLRAIRNFDNGLHSSASEFLEQIKIQTDDPV